jgi:NTP pyrophosphatase (non-canonical NTP hydrolase)
MKTIRELTAEIRDINVEKGWRPAEGGPGENTWGDYVALLHSEVSEMLEAYRDYRLEDGTVYCGAGENPKPEGVGAEAADVLIRLLDMCDVFDIEPFDMDMELPDVSPALTTPGDLESFGDRVTWLHGIITYMGRSAGGEGTPALVLRALVAVCEHYGIDLAAECERKIAYNRTRAFQHGGRTLAGNPRSA